VLGPTYHSTTLSTTSTETNRITKPHTIQKHVPRTGSTFSRKVLIYDNSPLRKSRTITTPSTIYDKTSPSPQQTKSTHTHTKTAIIALIEILAHCLPKTIPPSPSPIKTTIIYTDAFFSDGANTWRNSDFTEQDVRSSDFPPLLIHGTIPRKILQHFNLPATEHISTSLRHGQPLLTQPYIQLHDNDPECAAIHKGSGKRQLLNNLIGPHWAWLNRQQLTQFLRRVPS